METMKKWNFFDQASFLHPENQVFACHAYIFPYCDVMNYLYVEQACLHNLCMNRSSLDRETLDRVQ